jgi:hypothetical protein
MTDPKDAAEHLADVAKAMVNEAVDTAKAASDKIDSDKEIYGRDDLVATFTKLATTSMVGGLRLAETALQDRQRRPSDGLLVLADHLASIAQRTIRHARGVAEQTAKELDSKPFQMQPWVTAVTKLTDIAVVNTIEAAQTAIIGPARYAKPHFISDPFLVDGDLDDGELEVAQPFRRPGSDADVPQDRIVFDPPSVGPDRKEFRIVVNETGLPSGIYVGAVKTKGGKKSKPVTLRL